MTIKKVLSVTGIILVTVASLAACSSKSHTTKTGKKEVNFATVGTTAPFSYVIVISKLIMILLVIKHRLSKERQLPSN